jgi:hypothetical protein
MGISISDGRQIALDGPSHRCLAVPQDIAMCEGTEAAILTEADAARAQRISVPDPFQTIPWLEHRLGPSV